VLTISTKSTGAAGLIWGGNERGEYGKTGETIIPTIETVDRADGYLVEGSTLKSVNLFSKNVIAIGYITVKSIILVALLKIDPAFYESLIACISLLICFKARSIFGRKDGDSGLWRFSNSYK